MSDDSEQQKRFPEPELTRRNHIPVKEYGLLKTLEFPDGTIVHLNCKKGEESLRIYHSSGSYDEITSEGTKISIASNNSVSYAKGGMTVTYDQSSDSKGSGHMRVSFDHDAHVEFKKNASMVIGGHADIAALGHLKLAGKGDLYLGTVDGKVCISGGKGVEINAQKGRLMMEADGVVYAHSKSGDVHLESGENVKMNSKGSNITIAKGKITEKSDGNNTVEADSVGMKAQQKVSIKAESENVYLESKNGAVNAKGQVTKVDPPWVPGASGAPDIS